MTDPTPTTRDRELARKLVPELSRGWDAVPGVERLLAQARQEGREEGRRRYGFQEGQRVGLESAIRELKLVVDDLEKRARPLRRLLDQPAPEAKE